MQFPRFIFLFLLLAAAATTLSADDSKPVTLPETPPAVQKTIAAQIADGKLAGIEQKNEDGETAFDVRFTTKAASQGSFTVADDGTVLSVVVDLAGDAPAVQKTIQAQANGWKLEGIDKMADGADISFDVEVTKDGQEKGFSVADDGSLLNAEVALTATPPAVQAAIKAEMADSSLKSIEENFDPDGYTFDVTALAKDGSRKSFTVAIGGSVRSEEVTLDQVPPPGRATITQQIGNGKILRIDRALVEKKKKVLPYEVEGRKDGKPFDFSVGPKGRFLGMDD